MASFEAEGRRLQREGTPPRLGTRSRPSKQRTLQTQQQKSAMKAQFVAAKKRIS